MMFVLALMPGLPMAPFVLLGGVMAFVGYSLPKRQAAREKKEDARKADERAQAEAKESVKESLKTAEIELALGGHLSVHLLGSRTELGHRVAKIRKKFAKQYGFVIPEIKLTDNLSIDPKGYQIRIHDTRVAHGELRLGEVLVLVDKDGKPDVPGEEVIEPAFGMKALWVTEAFTDEVKRQGCKPVDNLSVLLTHLSEVIRANLAQLLSYKDMRGLLDRLDPEYKRLVDDLCPSQISYSGLLAILKILLAERVSIRNLHLILEAIAEIAPHVRRSEQVAEHVRTRLAQQICGDLSDNGVLNVVRLGNRWDLAFHQSLKRDAKGDVVEFDADPRLIEQFATEASAAIRKFTENGTSVVLAVTPEARPYVRMILERVFPTLPILSHVEVARSTEIRALGAIS
jgi:flagellar biosynthesis protein FlhA